MNMVDEMMQNALAMEQQAQNDPWRQPLVVVNPPMGSPQQGSNASHQGGSPALFVSPMLPPNVPSIDASPMTLSLRSHQASPLPSWNRQPQQAGSVSMAAMDELFLDGSRLAVIPPSPASSAIARHAALTSPPQLMMPISLSHSSSFDPSCENPYENGAFDNASRRHDFVISEFRGDTAHRIRVTIYWIMMKCILTWSIQSSNAVRLTTVFKTDFGINVKSTKKGKKRLLRCQFVSVLK